METIHVKLPKEQLEELDEVVKEKHYPSRSELVREAIRDLTEVRLSPLAIEKIKKGLKDIEAGNVYPLDEVL